MPKIFSDFDGQVSMQRSLPRWVSPEFHHRAAAFVPSHSWALQFSLKTRLWLSKLTECLHVALAETGPAEYRVLPGRGFKLAFNGGAEMKRTFLLKVLTAIVAGVALGSSPQNAFAQRGGHGGGGGFHVGGMRFHGGGGMGFRRSAVGGLHSGGGHYAYGPTHSYGGYHRRTYYGGRGYQGYAGYRWHGGRHGWHGGY